MSSKTRLTRVIPAVAASCLALIQGCSGDEIEQTGQGVPSSVERAVDPQTTASAPEAVIPPGYPNPGGGCFPRRPFDPDVLEHIPVELLDDILIQRLREPTPLGEDFAVHVRVPTSPDPELEASLVRVAGNSEAPIVLFSSDALAQMGVLEKSPGRGFFTSFARIDRRGLDLRARLEAESAAGPVNETALVFEGRNVVALTSPRRLDLQAIDSGAIIGLGRARLIPVSTRANWDEALFITHPDVVTDPRRTRDTCTNAGNACGPWTFCHLMTQMANTPRTGITPEAFARQWLEQWLRDYVVNDDNVPRRLAMQGIINPWLAASGGRQLDLRRAPFRLLAIVNRVDLRETRSGFRGYGGSGGGVPVNGGELRFIFGLMQPEPNGTACRPLPFTVIFEYGVPISGCENVRDWARRWTALDAMGGFGPAYRAALESITESIVRANVEPANGNGNAINQIRTNEIALERPWELREFTLNDQRLSCDTAIDLPSDGFLRPHTVAQTPDDAAHTPTANPLVDEYVNQEVVPSVTTAPTCSANYNVPPKFDCADDPTPFLGGNALAEQVAGGSPPGAWLANNFGWPFGEFVCGRHQFSLNTCNGCHTCDTDTPFTHVDPMAPVPVPLSGFLTGTVVPDTQVPGVNWTFNDLDRRYQDLYNVAGSLCTPVFPIIPEFFSRFKIDPIGPIVRDFDRFQEIVRTRAEFSRRQGPVSPVLDDLAAPTNRMSH